MSENSYASHGNYVETEKNASERSETQNKPENSKTDYSLWIIQNVKVWVIVHHLHH